MENKIHGLTSKEAQIRFEQYGANELKDTNKISGWKILFRQIKGNLIFYLLLTSMILSFILDKTITAYVVLVIIIIVITTGFVQEFKAEKSIEKLKDMITSMTIVIRDDKEKEIPTKEIVPGDVLILRTGEKIPSDCVVLKEKNLLVNEAVITGESDEVKKKPTTDINTTNQESILYSGSFIIEGKCVALVTHTGMMSKIGKIAEMISTAEKDLPLQKKVNVITKYMAIIGIVAAIVMGAITLLQSDNITNTVIIDILILVITISVSSFPEGLPVVFITTLSMGANRMAKKNAIVNRMSIIETMGETTVICSDKTGTITKGEMTVKKIFTNNEIVDVTGVGYEAKGDFMIGKSIIDVNKNRPLNLILQNATLCNDAAIERTGEESNEYKVIGTPTEAALLIMSAKSGLFKEDLDKRINEIPFSSERKAMHILYNDKGKKLIYSKGALDYLLKTCKYIQRDNGIFRLLERDKARILEAKRNMTTDCLRTIAFAYKEPVSKDLNKEIKDGMVFLGFVGIEDPARDGVKEALETCRNAGIKIKMITGDDKETAIAIAKQINLGSGKVLEGYQIDELTDTELTKLVKKIIIFARVRPEHKIRIVRALKENGEIVTMTGDGLNDAPALKEAHIGVAMGKNGTDVCRSVADLTLKDDNFVTLVDAIKEGRTIFNNIRKFVTYQLSCNFAELVILLAGVLLAPTLGWPVPLLLALQILFMNIVTDDLPAITLGMNKSSNDIMTEKPRKNAAILNKGLFKILVGSGIVVALFVLASFFITFNVLGQIDVDARTTALLALIMLEIAGAFNFRSLRKTTLNRSPMVNPYLLIASIISIITTVLVIYTPLNAIFETCSLPIADWIICIGLSLVYIFLFDTFKRINNKKHFLDLEH